jgi:hypothetical protein
MSDLDAPATKRDLLEFATKHDVQADLALLKAELLVAIADLKSELKSEMMKMLMWSVGLNVGALVAMTGIFAALVQWLRP